MEGKRRPTIGAVVVGSKLGQHHRGVAVRNGMQGGVHLVYINQQMKVGLQVQAVQAHHLMKKMVGPQMVGLRTIPLYYQKKMIVHAYMLILSLYGGLQLGVILRGVQLLGLGM